MNFHVDAKVSSICFFSKFGKQFIKYTPNKFYLMRWTIKPQPEPEQLKHLMDVLNIDEVTATLLIHRGITTFEQAKAFFRPNLDDLHDPFLMKDMGLAVDRELHRRRPLPEIVGDVGRERQMRLRVRRRERIDDHGGE